MRAFSALKAILLTFILSAVTESGAVVQGSTARSFALFSVSYNSSGHEAEGGVAGTVFFISPTQAITAYHVVNAASFTPNPGFERRRLWLVHEGQRPIEIRPEYLSYDRFRDLTRIQIPRSNQVAQRFVFESAHAPALNARVTSEGFRAGSAGPILERQGSELTISAVPKLDRLFASGTVVQRATVDLTANDVTLKNSPGLQLSYEPIKGMSGGPVIAAGKVIAMNSFADPQGFNRTWALELVDRL